MYALEKYPPKTFLRKRWHKMIEFGPLLGDFNFPLFTPISENGCLNIFKVLVNLSVFFKINSIFSVNQLFILCVYPQ